MVSLSKPLLEALYNSCTYFLPANFACCSGGLKNIEYSFGIGYGLSMAFVGTTLALQSTGYSVSSLIQSIANIFSQSTQSQISLFGSLLYTTHGLRTLFFVLRRRNFFSNLGQSGFAEKGAEIQEKSDKMPIFVKGLISFFVAKIIALYSIPLQLAYNQAEVAKTISASTTSTSFVPAFSLLAVSTFGLLIETIADEQKQTFKKANPKRPMMSGLFSNIMHANYTGEVLFHLGMFGLVLDLSGTSLSYVEQILSMFGPLYMTYVMFGAARRLDREGLKKYGENADYKKWREGSWSLIPGVF